MNKIVNDNTSYVANAISSIKNEEHKKIMDEIEKNEFATEKSIENFLEKISKLKATDKIYELTKK